MKEKKTRYLVPTGMSRTQEAFIENTALRTRHLWPVVVTVVRVTGQLSTVYYMTQACTGRRQRTQQDGQAGLGWRVVLPQGKCYWRVCLAQCRDPNPEVSTVSLVHFPGIPPVCTWDDPTLNGDRLVAVPS